jgi:hypothetical protein
VSDAVPVPVVQIDMPMMEQAIEDAGRILVVATPGSTVGSTQSLLQETATRLGKSVSYAGVTVEEAWQRLGEGGISGHNEAIAAAVRQVIAAGSCDCVALAHLRC